MKRSGPGIGATEFSRAERRGGGELASQEAAVCDGWEEVGQGRWKEAPKVSGKGKTSMRRASIFFNCCI